MSSLSHVLSTNIKRLRALHHLKQGELAKLADVSPHTLQRIESEQRWPKPDVLEKLASALNVTAAYLLESEGNRSSRVAERVPLESAVKSLGEIAGLKIEVKNKDCVTPSLTDIALSFLRARSEHPAYLVNDELLVERSVNDGLKYGVVFTEFCPKPQQAYLKSALDSCFNYNAEGMALAYCCFTSTWNTLQMVPHSPLGERLLIIETCPFFDTSSLREWSVEDCEALSKFLLEKKSGWHVVIVDADLKVVFTEIVAVKGGLKATLGRDSSKLVLQSEEAEKNMRHVIATGEIHEDVTIMDHGKVELEYRAERVRFAGEPYMAATYRVTRIRD